MVAYDPTAQQLMDGFDIAWGTQYEIARGVSDGRWRWADVTAAKLRQLVGKNQDTAHRVASVFSGKQWLQDHIASRSIW